jgi:5-methylcytosine-specific restriction endonuclease McrA
MTDERLKLLKPFIIQLLRRGTYRWHERNKALIAARIARGIYKCSICLKDFKKKDTRIDHILPVVDPTLGFQGFDSYIDRMFCDSKGFQVCCTNCHDYKTATEREIRKIYRKKRKQ